MSQLVIFGTGSFAEVAHFLFERDSDHTVVAFSVHADRISQPTFAGLPVVPFEDIHTTYPPESYQMFVAVGYTKVNEIRARIYHEAKELGYTLATYVSSYCTNWAESIGDNCFIFEDNTLQPFVTIGNNVVLWSGNHIGHHSTIDDHVFMASHIVVSGFVTIGAYTFVGVNATIRDEISVGRSNVIGAGALIMKSTRDNELYIAGRTKPDRRTPQQIDF